MDDTRRSVVVTDDCDFTGSGMVRCILRAPDSRVGNLPRMTCAVTPEASNDCVPGLIHDISCRAFPVADMVHHMSANETDGTVAKLKPVVGEIAILLEEYA